MSSSNDAILRLKEALSKDKSILLAYLFGSRAGGDAMPLSDYDIAVLLKDESLSTFAKVMFAASEALGIIEDKVDVLNLAKAPIHLKAKVLAEGIKIVDRGYEDSIRLEINTRYPEIAHKNKELLKKWLGNPDSLDLKVIKDRLDYLSQLSDNLRIFQERHNVREVSEDFEAWHALKSMVQDSVQAIIDICAHIFSWKKLGVAESYRQYVEKLVEHGHMMEELAEEIKNAIVIRNRLIHRYLLVKPDELWNFAAKLHRQIMPRFRGWTIKIAKESSKCDTH